MSEKLKSYMIYFIWYEKRFIFRSEQLWQKLSHFEWDVSTWGKFKKVFVAKIEIVFLFERSEIGVCQKAKNSVSTKIKSSK